MDEQQMIPEVAEYLRNDLAEKADLIKRRCADAEVKVEERTLDGGSSFLTVHLPNGRATRPVAIVSARDADRLLETSFEQYVALGDYQAICSYTSGVIEAAIRTASATPLPQSFVLRRLFGYDPLARRQGEDAKPIELRAPGDSGVTLTIGPMSRDLQVLGDRRLPRQIAPSLRIEGLRVSQHDAAVESLERIANAAFFEVDLKLNLPLTLVRERSRLTRTRPRAAEPAAEALEFPSSEYAQQPMALYWYARGAAGMPLLQYLAYYQSVEFFFPIYSQTEAHRRVRNILKDPMFSAHRDTDVSRLLSAIGPGYGRGFGNEPQQLRATMQECIDPDQLRMFLTEFPERAEFFAKNKVISERRLPLGNVTADLRNDVADRVYDIRCKIVHTKASESGERLDLLLPFSSEADALGYDIDLVQYLARRVLIASSTPIRI